MVKIEEKKCTSKQNIDKINYGKNNINIDKIQTISLNEFHNEFKKLLKISENPTSYELSLFEKTRKYIKFISWIPSLKMVAICNSLAMYATKETGSDIDLFIITSKNRIWITRIFITIIFQLLGVRRYGDKVKNRFCLSFFITEEAMDFSYFAIENDIYLYFWIYYLKPIYNRNYTYENFISSNKILGIDENNLHCDNLRFALGQKKFIITNKKKIRVFGRIGKKLIDNLEKILKKLFLPRTIKKRDLLQNSTGIIVEDNILKFHDNDKRIEIRDKIINMKQN